MQTRHMTVGMMLVYKGATIPELHGQPVKVIRLEGIRVQARTPDGRELWFLSNVLEPFQTRSTNVNATRRT